MRENSPNVDELDWQQLSALKTGALKTKYRELFGEESRSSNKQYLFRRIAWRLQALADPQGPYAGEF